MQATIFYASDAPDLLTFANELGRRWNSLPPEGTRRLLTLAANAFVPASLYFPVLI